MKNLSISVCANETTIAKFQNVAVAAKDLCKIKGGEDSIIIEDQVQG